MAGVIATEMLAADVPTTNKRRSAMAGKSKWKSAYMERYGKPKGQSKEAPPKPAAGKFRPAK